MVDYLLCHATLSRNHMCLLFPSTKFITNWYLFASNNAYAKTKKLYIAKMRSWHFASKELKT